MIFLLLLASSLHASLQDHFKPAPGKIEGCQVANIDFIYTINLDPRPEKFAKCVQQLSLYGIEPYRFSAVNGWELSLEAINDVGIPWEPWMGLDREPDYNPYKYWGTYYEGTLEPKHEQAHMPGRVYFCHCMSPGAVGIVLSHLSILQDAYDSGYETIWVMEDDVEVIANPHTLSDIIDELDALVGKEGWDILFTDIDTKTPTGARVPSQGFYSWKPNFRPNLNDCAIRYDISATLRRVGSRFGAYSMIVRRAGMEKILEFMKTYRIFLPYDIENILPPEIRLYSTRIDIVSTQAVAPSDNGVPNYKRQGQP